MANFPIISPHGQKTPAAFVISSAGQGSRPAPNPRKQMEMKLEMTENDEIMTVMTTERVNGAEEISERSRTEDVD
jgi:hypothetical protein